MLCWDVDESDEQGYQVDAIRFRSNGCEGGDKGGPLNNWVYLVLRTIANVGVCRVNLLPIDALYSPQPN